jgi:hypothetical protein
MFINESFLSFVWQYAYFNLTGLTAAGGQQLEILFPGHLNIHAGPDFNDARIRIDGILWMGAVEIHVRSSQWFTHRHQDDANYNRVILHVVWEHDRAAFRADGSEIPVLELFPRVSEDLIIRFRSLVYVPADKIACQPQLDRIVPVKINGMIQKALIQRLERKSSAIDHLLNEYNHDWEEVSYRWVVRNFGFKVNQDNMFLLAKFLPHVLILRHRNNLLRLEALFFGMAGFLEDERDEYQKRLKDEYVFLKHKYRLEGDFLKRHQWKFLRLHPQNFPTIRISQLAMFFTRINDFFSYVIHSDSIEKIYEDLKVTQSFYWQHNYDFGVRSVKKLSGLGKSSIDNLLINSFVPLLVAYSHYTDQILYQEKALALLERIKPENNKIVRQWKEAGLTYQNAADSQGLIELYTRYCFRKQCLNCNIGAEIMLNKN